ncbi:hypothetical protein DKG77_15300 [Flagellimonas aquimarina]|uniref:Uncharacterized protein n=1 Tax=Flagellimonas aquimarina TaxID=2201895 RepID=A0A316L0I5_9FLAO|nr:hypothetical protein [Allomuricauda koreensis]PWL37663.1 hypothetical protein DKG77_15300 [Allomuricauda koreensis]
MENNTKKRAYTEWLSADEMHEESKKWSSELKFAKDEQKFLNSMIKDYTLDLIDVKIFDEVKRVIDSLSKAEKNLIKIFKKVQLHENQLHIMVDEVDQIKMENAYVETHTELDKEVQNYFAGYRTSKTKIFKIISNIMKKKKQKRLLS